MLQGGRGHNWRKEHCYMHEEKGGLGQGRRGMGWEMDAIENMGEEHMVNGER